MRAWLPTLRLILSSSQRWALIGSHLFPYASWCAMPSRPWLRWFPADWRSDPRLRMCSLAARGLWIELLGYMHEAEPYGHLIVAGVAPSDRDIAKLVGASFSETKKCLEELRNTGVFSVNSEGMIYSRRMVRDHEKAERDRINGATGGNPQLISSSGFGAEPGSSSRASEVNQAVEGTNKRGVNPPENPSHKASRGQAHAYQKPDAREASYIDDEFEKFWRAYPSRGEHQNPRKPARQKFEALIRSGIDPAVITEGAEWYATYVKRHRIKGQYVTQAITWLSQARWEQPYINKPEALAIGMI